MELLVLQHILYGLRIAGYLEIRFAGTNFDSTAAVNDVWEVEVMGWSEEVDSNTLKPIRMTRRWQ